MRFGQGYRPKMKGTLALMVLTTAVGFFAKIQRDMILVPITPRSPSSIGEMTPPPPSPLDSESPQDPAANWWPDFSKLLGS